jgi:integrase
MKRQYNKREKITAATFDFSMQKLQYQIEYQGKGKAPDKRFDKLTQGLCLFIQPNGSKTFYAVKSMEMFNKKKNRMEKNAVFRKIFRMEDNPNRNYNAAKLELPIVLKAMEKPKHKTDEKLFGSLAKDFMKSGFSGYRLADKSEKHEYKETTIRKYKKLISTYLLLKGNDDIKDRMSKLFVFEDRSSIKPLKEYPLSEINKWHIDCVHQRLSDTKTTANDVIKVISIIYTWAIKKKGMKLINPVRDVAKFAERKIKEKLSAEDNNKILDYCEGKAFDYNPCFLGCVALSLYLGKRFSELLGLRWSAATTKKDLDECSGWLEDNWQRDKYLYLHDTKNRKPERVWIDKKSMEILMRLQRAKFTEANKWAASSPFLFPQRKNIAKAATYSSYRLDLKAMNKKLDVSFKFKIARKTAGSNMAAEYGVEYAARKLNHSSTKVTRDHYIVPDDKELERENDYGRSNIAKFKKAE